ncbi:MAG TPA: RusA family crossover junction endodeoxyribonuclease [Methanomassiliicoccales archaeon]|mgnify:CR=1 FL=1|jgi:Holliday junction resolvase RusA-like endonuclease|nr:RusA family crossover junction endodeoxyribonuclease [Euryarchaeota archaeon]HOO03848.1 RusA family crossover junction endodeoxyribonuclease [Methanomassiliicoccales archaeon]HRU11973.1 RusA family crossover junction endodeoxyribonuclease [Methanomassiliicoccales archaeon]
MHVVFEGADTEDYESGPMEYVGYQEGRFDQDIIEFFVAGEPVPQGSTKAYYIKKLERVVTTHTNANTENWRMRIATEAQRTNELRSVSYFSDDRRLGYEVAMDFVFTRPKSQPKKWRMNTKRPDLDKLVRAALDAITGVLIPDDSQVVRIAAGKSYGDGDRGPGLYISVRRVE